jgi:excisionase family DNA binding protein
MKRVFTTGQVAQICQVSPATVARWFDSGRLQGYRIPGSQDRRIVRESLLQFLAENGLPAQPLDSVEPDPGESPPSGEDGERTQQEMNRAAALRLEQRRRALLLASLSAGPEDVPVWNRPESRGPDAADVGANLGVPVVSRDDPLVKNAFTSGQVARLCRVAPRTVSKWFDSGRLQGVRIRTSGQRRVPRATLIQFLQENNMPLGELQDSAGGPQP